MFDCRGGQSLPETPLSRALVFGSINSIATVPTLIAFAASEPLVSMLSLRRQGLRDALRQVSG